MPVDAATAVSFGRRVFARRDWRTQRAIKAIRGRTDPMRQIPRVLPTPQQFAARTAPRPHDILVSTTLHGASGITDAWILSDTRYAVGRAFNPVLGL